MLVTKADRGVDAWGTPRRPVFDAASLDPLDFAEELEPARELNGPLPGQQSRPSRLDRARSHKEQGNVMFKKGLDYAGAAREYKRALHCMRRVTTEPRAALEKELRVPCYLNLAACDLELGDAAACERHASKALDMDVINVKALYRRAQARKYAARNLPGALADLKRAAALAPNDAAVQKALRALHVDVKRADEAERQAAMRMFASSSPSSSS